MFKSMIGPLIGVVCVFMFAATTTAEDGIREFSASSGGTLTLDLRAGGDVEIRGTGGSSIKVSYDMSCKPDCTIEFDEGRGGLEISTRFAKSGRSQSSNIDLEIEVPSSYDLELDSMGGEVTITRVSGTFTGETMGGELTLDEVFGEARLKTMGGDISLTNSELDGYLKTMGGEVLFENVVGDVKGSSMGGDVRYKNVQRRSGGLGSPARVGEMDEIDPETVQISTMGGDIEVDDAPEGADLHTMGGDIEITNAERFVRAKTMGGDIGIDSIDGWVRATTMGGDVDVVMTGGGGDVELTSMGGDITLIVPSGFGMDLDLEIAFTRNSRKEYEIEAPGSPGSSVTPDWDHDHGTPRKYIRSSGAVNGGGNTVKLRTVNGDLTIREE